MKAPASRLRRFPAFRQRGNDLQLLVAADQALIDMPVLRDRGGFTQRIGIERLERTLVGVAQDLGGGRRGRQSGDRDESRCKQGVTYRHVVRFSAMASVR